MKQGQPLISIAMAVYNGSRYLREQLDSVYAQTYKNIEVVVTDDGSSDGTIDILREYARTHGLKYELNHTRLGFVRNFERAVSLCSGQYIALSDQDDIWLPHKLQTLYAALNGYSLICSDAMLVDAEGRKLEDSFIRYSNNLPDNVQGTPLFTRLLFANFATGCTVLMKREVVQKAHPIPEGLRYHDWWYALVASTMNGVFFYDEPLVAYRQHESNDTGAVRALTVGEQLRFQWDRGYRRKRFDDGREALQRLQVYMDSGRFSSKETAIVEDVGAYYLDRQRGIIHFKAFILALKYRDAIYFNVPGWMRYLKCLRSLCL